MSVEEKYAQLRNMRNLTDSNVRRWFELISQ